MPGFNKSFNLLEAFVPSPTFSITADGNLPGINGGPESGGHCALNSCSTVVMNGDEAATNNGSGVHVYGNETASPAAADTAAVCAPLCGAKDDSGNACDLQSMICDGNPEYFFDHANSGFSFDADIDPLLNWICGFHQGAT